MSASRTFARVSRAGRSPLFPATVGLALCLLTGVRAAIPTAAKSDPRYKLGYLVVTHYAGVRSDGTGDATAGIQQAIEDACGAHLAVLFPAGTYRITDTLKCYKWQRWNPSKDQPHNPPSENHILVGSTLGSARPVIRLASSAPLFDDPAHPRPLLIYRNFSALNENATSEVEPTDPTGAPPNYEIKTPNLFGEELRGVDFDCGGHAGAIGVYFPAAQSSSIENVRVDATGAYAGFCGLPGRNGGAANIAVEGGRYGLLLEGSMAGTVAAGVTLLNQADRAIVAEDFVPICVVGFRIVKASGPVLTTYRAGWADCVGTVSMLDGIIELGSGLAIDNSKGKSLYLRNIYVTGTSELVKSKDCATVEGAGVWSRIAEYTYTEQTTPSGDPPYEDGDSFFRVFSVLDGAVSRVREPVLRIEPNVGGPPADLVRRHVWTELPSYEGQSDGTIVVTAAPYGATPDDESDDRAAIQAAIDAASAAGHGRVFVPGGTFRIGNTLTLRANTVLLGAGRRISRISYHDSWRPTTGEATMIRTENDAEATTFLGFIEIHARTIGGGTEPSGANTWDRFNHLHWRAGRCSMTVGLQFAQEWDWPEEGTNPRSVFKLTDNAGGRHYFVEPNSRSGDPGFRCLLVNGTTEPLSFYGLNVEATKKCSRVCDTNCEIIDSENIRIYSVKREGVSPTLIVRDSRNVAMFSSGAMRGANKSGLGGYVQVYGASDGITMANLITQTVNEQDPNGEPMLREDLDGLPRVEVVWPECVSVYKRGALDDAAMAIGAPTVSLRVAAGADDAEERLDTGAMSLASSDLELVRDASDQLVGVRFRAVPIAAGSTIERAWLEFATDEPDSEPTALTISAEAGDSAAAFSASTGDLSRRARTSAQTAWTPGQWSTLGKLRQTPDLAGLVQEVVERPGWQSGNALAFLIGGTGKRVVVSYDGDPAAAPKLCVIHGEPRPPRAPFGVSALVLSATEIRVTWLENSDDEAGFLIDRRESGASDWVRLDTLSPDSTFFADTGVSEQTKYYYKLKAWNAVGESAYSDVVSATTPMAPPAAPAGLVVFAVDSSTIELAWQDSSGNEETFKIDRRQSGTSGWERIAALAPNTSTHVDNGLPAATKFYYKVKAYNSAGNSAYTELVDAKTPDGVFAGASWRYRKGTAEASNPAEAWRGVAFDDSGWAQGAGPFGYGDGPYGTELTDMRGNYTCLFLRRRFEVGNPAAIAALRLAMLYDDGFIVWVNGHEIARHNMDGSAGTPVRFDATATNAVGDGTARTTWLSGGGLPVLRAGENVVAVQVFNVSLGQSSDFTADVAVSLLVGLPLLEQDADQDGMPDEWEAAYLSDLPDPADRLDLADPDNDGLSNLAEYIAGTSPCDGNSAWGLTSGLIDGELTVSMPTIAAAGTGYSGRSRHYALQARAADGAQWLTVAGYEDILGMGQTERHVPAAAEHAMIYRARTWLE